MGSLAGQGAFTHPRDGSLVRVALRRSRSVGRDRFRVPSRGGEATLTGANRADDPHAPDKQRSARQTAGSSVLVAPMWTDSLQSAPALLQKRSMTP